MDVTEDPDAGVCVFAPSTIVTVTVEGGGSVPEELHFHAGGQGFWIARLLGRLGVPTTMCTVLGGESGRVATALLATERIDVRAVQRDRENGAWVHDRRSGERSVIADVGGEPLRRHETDELIGATLVAALRLGICVLTGPQHEHDIDAEHYGRLARDLRANGVEVIADLSGGPLEQSLDGGVDFCKVSDEDLDEADQPPEDERGKAVDRLRGAIHAVVTRADRPALATISGSRMEVVGPSLEAVDHRGAGDAFTALVAASRYWGMTWEDAVRWGAAAGALTVTRRGLATADRREIHHLVGRIELRPFDPVP